MNALQPPTGKFFEDLEVGATYAMGSRTIFESDITAFVNCVGLQEELFTNLEVSKEMFGKEARLAPGALSYLFAESLHIPFYRGSALAFLGMNLEMQGPAFAGDTLTVWATITETRVSKSRPDAGLVRSECRVENQLGQPVLVYKPLRLIRRRD